MLKPALVMKYATVITFIFMCDTWGIIKNIAATTIANIAGGLKIVLAFRKYFKGHHGLNVRAHLDIEVPQTLAHILLLKLLMSSPT